jgi:glycosidase
VRRARSWSAGLALIAALWAGAPVACKSSAPAPAIPARSCSVVVWHQPASAQAHVEVVGDFNGWARPGLSMQPAGAPGWYATRIDYPPGEHQYAIVEDGTWLTDPTVPTTAFHDDQEVTWLDVPDCATPGLQVTDATANADGTATVHATFLASTSRDALDPGSLAVTERDGTRVTPASIDAHPGDGTIALSFAGLAPGKHVLRLDAADARGRAADPAWATAWIEPRAWDPRDMVLYQVIVDRYRGPGGAPLAQPSVPSARAGGTIDGVRAAIDSGELAALGVNALWLSPLYLNPDGDFPGNDGRPYSSYHGYWPIAPRALDPRVATEDAVDALLADAHAHGLRVLFDVVPNHVHEQHPYFTQHANDGWFDDMGGTCICGQGACDWSTHIQDCWFAPYLPDLAWKNPAVADQITSDVLWWLDRFDADGLRIDAVPMMPRAATRRIAAAVRAKYGTPSGSTFLLGENFVGGTDYDLLRYYLGPFGLDSEFHFPLMWALRAAIADESEPLGAIDSAVTEGASDWAGSGAVMATMIGNHDVVRFATESNGDASVDGWTPAAQPADGSDVYAKQVLALGAVLTLPGAPVIYYGDELALVGHGDPDSRHVMPAESDLTSSMRSTRDAVRLLGKARACSDALRRGTYRMLYADAEHLAFARELPGGTSADTAVVLLFRRSDSLSASLPGITDGEWVDVLTGRVTSLASELTNAAGAPLSLQLLFPKGSPCAPP